MKLTNTATDTSAAILVLNAGSSSIKFGIYTRANCKMVIQGELTLGDSTLSLTDAKGDSYSVNAPATKDQKGLAGFLIQSLELLPSFSRVHALGHRVVQGLYHSAPAIVTESLVEELKTNLATDPEHLPLAIALMETLLWRHPSLFQVVCFDTAFHHNLPTVAKLLPIPRRYTEKGIRRYGFHGISYAYLMSELTRLGDPTATQGKIILAHLGKGASMAAVLDGSCIDTSMGFTPVGGLPMSTGSGDLDAGLLAYLAASEKLTGEQLQQMVKQESGLLGVSDISADMRELLDKEATEPRAAEAIALFCYQARKWIGAYTAALGGLDTLVFSGGMGAHSPEIRTRICAGLEYLGLELNQIRNSRRGPEISSARSRVKVYAITTQEELMIARSVAELLTANNK